MYLENQYRYICFCVVMDIIYYGIEYRYLFNMLQEVNGEILYFIGVGGFLVEMGFLVVWWNFYDLYFV